MFSKELLIFDGGFASQLVKDGHDIYDDPLWSARLLHSNPNVIKSTHRKFLEAGADAVISSSYQASLKGFEKYLNCSIEEAKELMKLSAKLVKDACEEFWQVHQKDQAGTTFPGRQKPLAVASLGPYGACLLDCSEYRGDYVDTVAAEVS
uniref:Hcy-binding domain-containing protein n=2 Tax=Clytia hemisphaerica TaxID=252671 RepID=A0A7M5VFK5_9CNID